MIAAPQQFCPDIWALPVSAVLGAMFPEEAALGMLVAWLLAVSQQLLVQLPSSVCPPQLLALPPGVRASDTAFSKSAEEAIGFPPQA